MATIKVHEIIGDAQADLMRANTLAGDLSDKTNSTIRFKKARNATVDANNPLTIPSAGTSRSFEKVLVFFATDIPADERVQNLRFYCDGASAWTGVKLKAGVKDPQWQNDDAMGAADQAVGYVPPASDAASAVAVTDIFDPADPKDVNDPLDMDAADDGPEEPGFLEAHEGNHIGDLLYLQMEVLSTASAGTLAGETLTFAWDEINI